MLMINHIRIEYRAYLSAQNPDSIKMNYEKAGNPGYLIQTFFHLGKAYMNF